MKQLFVNDQTVPVRESSTSTNSRPRQSGFLQKKVSRAKKYVAHARQREASSAGASGSRVNHPSSAGTWVFVPTVTSSSRLPSP